MTSSRTRLIVGLDVHQETIFAASLNPASGELGTVRQFKNLPDRLAKYIASLRSAGYEPEVCYEASSCGYVIYRQLAAMEVACDVIAPTSIPKRAGDRVKTDRRDAEKLATMHASGLLASVQVPDRELEQIRTLSRCRSTLAEDLTRLKHRTTRLLESRGYVYRSGTNWTHGFWAWLRGIRLEGKDQTVLEVWINAMEYVQGQIQALEAQLKEAAQSERFRDTVTVLGAFRGIGLLTALTLATELGDLRRFSSPRQLMGYLGLVPSEYSSGKSVRRGGITKTGNVQARKALVSSAWKYAARPCRSARLKQRQEGAPPGVVALSWKAQQRLHKRFHALAFRKPRSVANVAVARELIGFLWAALQSAPTPARAAA